MFLKSDKQDKVFGMQKDLSIRNVEDFSSLKDPEQVLSLLGFLQQYCIIRSIDRNFSSFLYQAYLSSSKPSLSANENIDASILLVTAILSKQVGKGHVCLRINSLVCSVEQYLSAGDIVITQNSELTYKEVLNLLKQIQTSLNKMSVLALCKQLKLSPLVNEVTENVSTNQNNTAKPLVLHNGRLYLERLFYYESSIVSHINDRISNSENFEHQNPIKLGALKTSLAVLFKYQDQEQAKKGLSQKLACALAARSRFAVITGGPGTGKTTTVVKLLVCLQAMQSAFYEAVLNNNEANTSSKLPAKTLRIGLAAPTGKAAARLSESIGKTLGKLPFGALPGTINQQDIPSRVSTIDVLLGRSYQSRKFKYNANKSLPLDVLVIDEASMVDVDLMAALVQALDKQARLILLGDKDQLASVDAGAVFGDLAQDAHLANYRPETIAYLQNVMQENIDNLVHLRAKTPVLDANSQLAQNIAMLTHSFRFAADSGIKLLAEQINLGNTQSSVWNKLKNGQLNDSIWLHNGLDVSYNEQGSVIHSSDFIDHIKHGSPDAFASAPAGQSQVNAYAHYFSLVYTKTLCTSDDRKSVDTHALKVLLAFDKFRILSAIKSGPWGVDSINQTVEQVLLKEYSTQQNRLGEWYSGRPVLVTKNDYNLGLMNGDIGICFAFYVPNHEQVKFKIAFKDEQAEYGVNWFSVNRVQNIQSAYAMTVHKSQGSEFEHTCLVLPEHINPVLTKELVYTAVTRAKSYFSLLTPKPSILSEAISQQVTRDSGLFTKT